jgi:hypothetical protein
MKKVAVVVTVLFASFLYAIGGLPFQIEGKFNYNMLSNAGGVQDLDANVMNIGINAVLPVFMGLKARLDVIGFEMYTVKPEVGDESTTNTFSLNLLSGGDLMYCFPVPTFNPYLFMGLGVANVSPEVGDAITSFKVRAGVGGGYSLPTVSFFLEAGYEMFDSGIEGAESEGTILIGAGARF